MIVGDAGALASMRRSDYTVLGDTVNLAARLESANKASGTCVLVTRRTVELAGGENAPILFRVVARLRVVGKNESVDVYEPLGFADQVGDDRRRLAQLTRDVFDAFVAGRFHDCLDALAKMEQEFGPTKLQKLYERVCRQRLADPSGEFDGTIWLDAK
jgi:adenylate cyclase